MNSATRISNILGIDLVTLATMLSGLAAFAVPRHEVDARWEEMLDAEAKILAAQPAGPRIHSGLPD